MLISQTDHKELPETDITLYYLPDAQGSTRALAKADGSLGQTFDYDAFGNLEGDYSTSGLDTNYLYTGQQYDAMSELYSLRARYYDASIGRFLSRDTWAYDYQNPVELNRYVYTANNPATWSDPSGYMYVATLSPSASATGTPGGPGWGRMFSAGLGAGLGAAIGYIGSNMMFNIMDSGACGGGLAAWAKSNRTLYTTMATVTGALIGGISGYFAPEIALGHATGLGTFMGALQLGDAALGIVEWILIPSARNICTMMRIAMGLSGYLVSSNGGGGGPQYQFAVSGGAMQLELVNSSLAIAGGLLAGQGVFMSSSKDGPPPDTGNDGGSSGPGEWQDVNEHMSQESRDYQAQIAGEEHRGQAYKVDGVSFDGYDEGRRTLLDAKARHSQFLDDNGQFKPWWKGTEKFIDEAQRQINVAGEHSIEWHIMEADVARAIRSLFNDNNIRGIRVIHVPSN